MSASSEIDFDTWGCPFPRASVKAFTALSALPCASSSFPVVEKNPARFRCAWATLGSLRPYESSRIETACVVASMWLRLCGTSVLCFPP